MVIEPEFLQSFIDAGIAIELFRISGSDEELVYAGGDSDGQYMR